MHVDDLIIILPWRMKSRSCAILGNNKFYTNMKSSYRNEVLFRNNEKNNMILNIFVMDYSRYQRFVVTILLFIFILHMKCLKSFLVVYNISVYLWIYILFYEF